MLGLIEVYGHAPDPREFRACLSKHLALWQERERKARRSKKRKQPQTEAFVEPLLWIITAGAPAAVLTKLSFLPELGWTQGVYFGSEILRVGIVVARELPRDRSTLLVRALPSLP